MEQQLLEDFERYLLYSGQSIKHIASAIGLKAQTLYNWRTQTQALSESKRLQLRAYLDTGNAQ